MNELLKLGYKEKFIKEYKNEDGDDIARTITFNAEDYTVAISDYNIDYDRYEYIDLGFVKFNADELKAILATLEELKARE